MVAIMRMILFRHMWVVDRAGKGRVSDGDEDIGLEW